MPTNIINGEYIDETVQPNNKLKILKWKKDNDERVTRKIVKIHNKYYDITNFAHPGGPIAIMAANRRDATALFESHHPFSDRGMMDNILKK